MQLNALLRPVLLVLALLLPATVLVGPTAVAAPAATTVTISPVDLDGPTISDVTVRVTNRSSRPMRRLEVTFSGPVGWSVDPDQRRAKALRPGRSVALGFQIRVPEQRPGFRVRTFEATVTYRGGDGNGTATGTRTQRTGEPLADLAAAYGNVGVTDESDTAPGDFDGDGNSFSAQQLASQAVTPGGTVSALGTDFTWPDVPAGSPNNVVAAGQAVDLNGRGDTLAFLGSGSSFGATGTATVHYADGSTSTGSFGFPNWSFQEPDAHDATLVVSTDGRNTPAGYGDAAYQYRVFAHSIPVDASRTVDFVVLPSSPTLHVFDMRLGTEPGR